MVGRGFAPDVPYWRRKSDETIDALFIENYYSGFLFYISLGVYVIGLSDKGTRKPKLRQMHAWCRLSQLTPVTTQGNGNIALRGDGMVNTNKIVDESLEAIRTVGFATLDELSSIAGTKKVLERYGEMRWMIGPLLKDKFFGNPSIELRGTLPLREWEIAGSVDPYHKDKDNAVI